MLDPRQVWVNPDCGLKTRRYEEVTPSLEVLSERPHRRFNPLTGEWVLVSPHRARRPWQGQEESINREVRPDYDPTCYLCPTNVRANGSHNPDYKSTFVFENDFGALQVSTPEGKHEMGSLLRAESEKGISKVICFSPRHDLTLPDMEVEDIRKVDASAMAAWEAAVQPGDLEAVPDLERHGWRSRRPLADAIHLDTWRDHA